MLTTHPHRDHGRRRRTVWTGAAVLVCLLAALAARADTLTRRDGTSLEGTLVSADAAAVVWKTSTGNLRVPRGEIDTIRFGSVEPAPPPIKVEVRNLRSDDAVDVLLNDDGVLREGRSEGSWVDLTPKLKEGNNALRLRIHNDRGTWAYRLSVRINGEVQLLSCGTPLRTEDPCRCCGKTGHETGTIDDLPVIWLYVDRRAGRAELVP